MLLLFVSIWTLSYQRAVRNGYLSSGTNPLPEHRVYDLTGADIMMRTYLESYCWPLTGTTDSGKSYFKMCLYFCMY